MKRPRVDYSGFSPARIREPRFSHMLLLLCWIGYFILYLLTENLIPASSCHPVHCRLDDLIPFNEFFAVFYVGWYLLVAGSLLFYFLYDVERFRKLQIFIGITMALAMICYIVWPSRQDLRPESFERHNLLTMLMGLIYTADTSTGVCPSLHVAFSLGILSVGLKDEYLSRLTKCLLTVLVLLICMSVCFVKQHSVLDVAAAVPVALIAELLVFRKDWTERFRRRKEKK